MFVTAEECSATDRHKLWPTKKAADVNNNQQSVVEFILVDSPTVTDHGVHNCYVFT